MGNNAEKRKEAEALYSAKKWAEADMLFAALKRDGETDGDLMHDHAVCIFQLGRKKEALDEFDRAGRIGTGQGLPLCFPRLDSGGDERRGWRHCGLQKSH